MNWGRNTNKTNFGLVYIDLYLFYIIINLYYILIICNTYALNKFPSVWSSLLKVKVVAPITFVSVSKVTCFSPSFNKIASEISGAFLPAIVYCLLVWGVFWGVVVVIIILSILYSQNLIWSVCYCMCCDFLDCCELYYIILTLIWMVFITRFYELHISQKLKAICYFILILNLILILIFCKVANPNLYILITVILYESYFIWKNLKEVQKFFASKKNYWVKNT